MTEREIHAAIVLDGAAYTVEDVACVCATSVQWVVHRVEEGALACRGSRPDDWRFAQRDLTRARRMRAVERDFDAVPELAALVADMLDEIDALRERLRSAGMS